MATSLFVLCNAVAMFVVIAIAYKVAYSSSFALIAGALTAASLIDVSVIFLRSMRDRFLLWPLLVFATATRTALAWASFVLAYSVRNEDWLRPLTPALLGMIVSLGVALIYLFVGEIARIFVYKAWNRQNGSSQRPEDGLW